MASIIRVDDLQDSGGNSIVSSNGSGTITVGNDALKNTPSFFAYLGSNQSISNGTTTIAQIDTEVYDSGGVFNTSTYKWTPATTGVKYYIFGQASLSNLTVDKALWVYIYKNGSIFTASMTGNTQSGVNDTMVNLQVVDEPNATDYYELRVYHNDGSTETLRADNKETQFGAIKIIGG